MDQVKKHRLFLAIPVPHAVTHDLKQRLRLSAKLSSGRWITAGNVHVTLRFLGSVPVDLIDELWDDVKKSFKNDFQPFDCLVKEIVHLPENRPRLIAATIAQSEQLEFLYNGISAALSKFQVVEKTSPFLPHITLYRCRKHCKPIVPIALADCRFSVNEVILYRSEPSPTGSIYTKIHAYSLDK